jgi:hypothetical protein
MTHLRELNVDLGPTNGVIARDGKMGAVGTGNMTLKGAVETVLRSAVPAFRCSRSSLESKEAKPVKSVALL